MIYYFSVINLNILDILTIEYYTYFTNVHTGK